MKQINETIAIEPYEIWRVYRSNEETETRYLMCRLSDEKMGIQMLLDYMIARNLVGNINRFELWREIGGREGQAKQLIASVMYTSAFRED